MTSEILRERMEKLIIDLRESEGTRKQNFCSLAEIEGDHVDTYCALGAIGCEKNIVGVIDDPDHGYVLQEPREVEILNMYGIHYRLKHPIIISYYFHGMKKYGLRFRRCTTLNSIIINLNDEAHCTFTQIAEYLGSLVSTDIFKICSKADQKKAEKLILKD